MRLRDVTTGALLANAFPFGTKQRWNRQIAPDGRSSLNLRKGLRIFSFLLLSIRLGSNGIRYLNIQ